MADLQLPSWLTSSNVHVVISTLAGAQEAHSHFQQSLSPFLGSRHLSFTTHITESSDTIAELTRNVFLLEARKGVRQTIILLSGDGGVIDIVNTLATSVIPGPRSNYIKPTLALIPMGTANALAHSSGIATDPYSTLTKGEPKPLPIFQAQFSLGSRLVYDEGRSRRPLAPSPSIFGSVVFSWGLHASLVAESDTAEMRKHGVDRFKMAAQRLFSQPTHYRGRVEIKATSSSVEDDDNDWQILRYSETEDENKDEHVYVLTTLVSSLEQHFRISPASRPLAGSLYLVAIRPVSGDQLMKLMQQVYRGGAHVQDENVVYREVDGLRITFPHGTDEKWRTVCVDGTIVAVDDGGWVEVKRLGRGKEVVDLVC